MKSNRMRFRRPALGIERRLQGNGLLELTGPLQLEQLPAPLPIAKVAPDQVIEDILLATLRRVQKSGSPEVAAAAARYMSLLTESPQ